MKSPWPWPLAGRRGLPWDLTQALDLALLEPFWLRLISGLLSTTGELAEHLRNPYDHTARMVGELLRHKPESPEGRAVIMRMNRIHASYGWRALTATEREAVNGFWKRVGVQMGIRAITDSVKTLLAFKQRCKASLFAVAFSNRPVANVPLMTPLRDWPEPLRQGIRRLLQALPEAAVSTSLCWSTAPAWLPPALRSGLRPVRGTRFCSERPTPSYGNHSQLEQLGPPALLGRLNRSRWGGSQRRIGLTGGIATGKSTVGQLLAELHGLPVLDADHYAREALAPGSAASLAVLGRYGPQVQASPGAAMVDRAALGHIVFTDIKERRWLEQLVHPIVRGRFKEELGRLKREKVVVLMVPLLFEAGLEELCSEVWLVECDEAQQLARLTARDQLSTEEAKARIAAQWPLECKRRWADVLINNRDEPQQLVATVERALRSMGHAD